MTITRSTDFDRKLWKAADRIHRRLRSVDRFPQRLRDANRTWECWQATSKRLATAMDRGWAGAVNELRRESWSILGELISYVETGRNQLDPEAKQPDVASVQDIYRDLVALKTEFPAIDCDLREKYMSAITEPITLEEVPLGAFEIRLSWCPKYPALNYDVIAVDPNPSTRSEDITHPHVENERLCAGDGRFPIEKALKQGRLLDFFLIVSQVLDTYNASSAYVELRNWYGETCPDCGADVCDDDVCTCEDCETCVCGECMRWCDPCGCNVCGECSTTCPQCDEPTCQRCFVQCSECKTNICKGCIDDDEKTCRDCITKKETAPAESAAATAGVALQPVCLGEVVVPA